MERKGFPDTYFNAYHLSDGTLRFICLVTLLIQPNPPKTIIIIPSFYFDKLDYVLISKFYLYLTQFLYFLLVYTIFDFKINILCLA